MSINLFLQPTPFLFLSADNMKILSTDFTNHQSDGTPTFSQIFSSVIPANTFTKIGDTVLVQVFGLTDAQEDGSLQFTIAGNQVMLRTGENFGSPRIFQFFVVMICTGSNKLRGQIIWEDANDHDSTARYIFDLDGEFYLDDVLQLVLNAKDDSDGGFTYTAKSAVVRFLENVGGDSNLGTPFDVDYNSGGNALTFGFDDVTRPAPDAWFLLIETSSGAIKSGVYSDDPAAREFDFTPDDFQSTDPDFPAKLATWTGRVAVRGGNTNMISTDLGLWMTEQSDWVQTGLTPPT